MTPRGPPGSVNAPPPELASADDSLLTYALWVWQDTQLANGTRVVPDGVGRYTVEFQPDGKVNVRADCNRGSGKYVQAGARLTIEWNVSDRYVAWVTVKKVDLTQLMRAQPLRRELRATSYGAIVS